MRLYVDPDDALNRDHPLNRGLTRWWLGLPELVQGRRVRGIVRGGDAILGSASSPANSFAAPRNRRGGIRAFDFSGNANDYWDAGDINETDGVTQLTVSLWVRMRTLTDFVQWMSKFSTTNNRWQVGLAGGASGSNDDVLMAVGQNFAFTTASVLTVNDWSHLIFVYDGSQVNASRVRVWLNGIERGTTTSGIITTSVPSTTAPVTIGARSDGGNRSDGRMDDIRIYGGRALSADDAVKLFTLSQGEGYHELLKLLTRRSTFYVEPAGGTTVQIGQVVATSTAQPVASAKAKAITQALETATAQPVTFTKAKAILPALETDTAAAINSAKLKAIGQVLETITAFPVALQQQGQIGQALEQDTAHPLTHTKAAEIGQAQETATAQSLAAQKAMEIGQVVEVATAQPVTAETPTGIQIGQVVEVTSTFPLTHTIAKTIGLAVETDMALGLVFISGGPVGGPYWIDALGVWQPGSAVQSIYRPGEAVLEVWSNE